MPIYSIPAPNGLTYEIEGPEGATREQVIAEILRRNPEALKSPESGPGAAFRAGYERLKGNIGALGAGFGVEGGEEYAKQQEAKARGIFKPSEFKENPFRYVGELAAGSAPYMAAPIIAGGAATLGGAPALAATGLAGLASAAQFTGSNIQRQIEEGKSGKDIETGKAFAASIPQAALDMVGFKMLPGVRQILGMAGKEVSEATAQAIAKQGTLNMLKDYGVTAAKTAGAEGLTEAGQQFLERLQAGLSLTDEKARDEYWDNLVGGALLGGIASPAGRYIERGKEQDKAAAEQAKRLREQRVEKERVQQEAAAAEEARKQTPEYALDIEKQYLAMEQQKKDLQAQVKKIDKASPTVEADKAANQEIHAQLKELQPQLKELGGEYHRTAGARATAQEQQRVAKLSPEEFMLEQTMRGEGVQAAGRAKGERGALFGKEEAAAPVAPVDTTLQDYASGQIEAARNSGALGMDNIVGYLMQNPQMADQLVKTRTKMPGLSRQENDLALNSLKLQLKEATAKQAAADKEKAARAERLQGAMAGQAPGSELMGAMRQMPGVQAAQQERVAEEQRLAKVTPEMEALQRIGQRPAGGMDQFNLSGIAPTDVGVQPPAMPITKSAPTVKRTVDELYAARDKARQDETTARAAGETAAARAAAARAEEAQQTLSRITSSDEDFAPYAQAHVGLRNKQEQHFFELTDVLDKLRRGVVLGGPASEEATTTRAHLQKQAEAQRADLIRSVLEEAALHRRAQGLPAITTDEAVKAADQINTVLEEAITRMQSTPQKEEVVTSPAQMRGTKLIKGAETEMRDTRELAERPLRSPQAAFGVFQEQINNVRDGLINAKTEPTAVRPLLRTQSAEREAQKTTEARGENATTLGGELRRRTEYVRNKMSQMKDVPAPARGVLNAAADLMDAGRASRDLLNAVESVVDSINSNRQITQTDLRTVKDATTAVEQQAQQGENVNKVEGQKELFTSSSDRALQDKTLGVVRGTPEAFANSPAMKKVQKALEQAKEAMAAIKAAQEAAGRVEAAKQEKLEERVTAKAGSVEAQRRDLQQAIYDAMSERRAAYQAAAKAQAPQVMAAQKALDTAEADLSKLEELVAAIPNSGTTRSMSGKIRAQKDAIDAARTNLDKAMAEASAEYDGRDLVVEAHQDSLVQFERKALDKMQKELDKLVASAATPRSEVAAAQNAVQEQRTNTAKAENDARVAKETADRERRQLEQRRLNGLGLVGIKRVAGEIAVIKDEKSAAVAAEQKKARANLEQAQDALAGRPETKQVARATGPVTRTAKPEPSQLRTGTEESKAGETRVPGEMGLSESRTPAPSKRSITTEEMKVANNEAARIKEEARAANEEAERLKGMTPAQKRKAEKEAKAVEKELAKSRAVYRTAEGGKGVNIDGLKRLVARITQDWKNVPGIVSVQTYDDLPDHIKAEAKKDGVEGRIPGVYDTQEKVVYLVADTLHSAEDVVATIAHEVAGHFGLREMLGNQYTKTMNDLYNGNRAVREQADAKLEAMPSLEREVAVEEVLAEMAEAPPTADSRSALRKIYDTIKEWVKKVTGFEKLSDKAVQQIVANARKYVIEGTEKAAGEAPQNTALYRTKAPKYANDSMASVGEVADKLIAKQRSFTDDIKQEGMGLGLATRLIDRFAPLEAASKLMDSLKGIQMMYYARMYDQKMNFLAQAVGNGALALNQKTRPDGRTEWVVESEEGASLKSVVNILKEAGPIVGSPEAASRLFSLYTVAKRAERVGLNKLNFGGAVTQAELNEAMTAIKNEPGLVDIFEEARKEYNAYNKGMVNFAVQTGALSKDVAAKMLKSEDYVPYYRTAKDGSVQMWLGNENIAQIGNLKNQPYLQELVGGDEQILDFMTSAVQNSNMLVDMALRNLATKSAAYELRDIGLAETGPGTAVSGPNVVHFKVDGKDHYARIDTSEAGFPGELLVKGLEGIPYQTTWLTKAMGAPARVLRKAVVLSPVYAAKQLFRDSLAAPLLSGANFTPVMGALKQLNGTAGKTLEQRGIVGGKVFTGTQEDLTDLLRKMNKGEAGWVKGLAKLEAISMEADALTRRAQYNSYIEQGLSEMEATYMALESMNFSKRGASPAMHFLSTVIPFFNSQVQSLNVMYKALTGNMPFNEKLKIREKMIKRGLVLAGTTMVYAALMQDDETYKNATPEQKYGNWFVHVPGVDEAVRVPIPFEVGYIFKALPEAVINIAANEHGGEEAVKAFKDILLKLIPGGSSYGIPQIMKPLVEVSLGKSFYTGRDLESAHEQMLVAGKRSRDNTTEFAKTVGEMFNVSPIKIDTLIQGYLSGTGLALVDALSFAIPTPKNPERAALRASEYRIVGGLFQPKDAGGIINATYERMQGAEQVKNTFDDLNKKGRTKEAEQFLKDNLEEFAEASLATNFKQTMSKLTQAEGAIRASNMSADEQRRELDLIRQAKIKIATAFREGADKTRRQVDRP